MGEDYMMMMEEYGMMGEGGSVSPYAPAWMAAAAKKEEKKSGFVVTMVGYSPYKSLGELLDPVGVDNQRNRWGLVTRLLHLDEMVADGNSPFKLYERTDVNHFELRIEDVDLETGVPPGVGIVDVKFPAKSPELMGTGTRILLDPMTKEIIGKMPVLDEYGQPKLDRGKPMYEINDHWFVLNAKFVWKDAPASPERPTTATLLRPQAAVSPSTTSSTTTSTSTRSKRKSVEVDF
jgi:hypothetical protein